MRPCALVVPCFNEARRLDTQSLRPLGARADLRLILVDDGSTDGTAELLRSIAESMPDCAEVLALGKNVGKGEAVRAGLNHGLGQGCGTVGFADADMSTPAEEVLRLLDIARSSGAQLVMGSRVKLLGRRIVRQEWRHYLGRAFATGASLALKLPVYDTQCGVKFLRSTEAVRAALARPFRSRWAFDVELIGRLLASMDEAPPLGADEIIEVPLRTWVDTGGSKVKPAAAVRAALELLRVARDVRRSRSRRSMPT